MAQQLVATGSMAQVVEDALRAVVDPELGMNIVELGLVYLIDAEPQRVTVQMTMTSPGCPVGESIVADARAAIGMALPDAREISVDLVWEPPWSPEMMDEVARGFFGWSQP
jgi:metal-sulfur cluster biosynthetic enzyme